MRTLAEIDADIAQNGRDFEEMRKYFGAMWGADVQANIVRRQLDAELDKLRQERIRWHQEQEDMRSWADYHDYCQRLY